jgi:carbonic anhydrase/acetyltransferase-like protein (isoleucine patch superfamily)
MVGSAVQGETMKVDSAIIDDLSRDPPLSAIGTRWQLFTDRVMGGVSNGTMVREMVAGRPSASLRGDMGRILLRDGSNVQDGCILHAGSKHDTTVGEGAIIAHGAILHGCEIRKNALIGMKSIVMDKAIIGEQAFVAAMSLVKAGSEVPAGMLAMGIPARVLRTINQRERAFLETGARVYQDLAQRSLAITGCCAPLRRLTARRLGQRISPEHSDDY